MCRASPHAKIGVALHTGAAEPAECARSDRYIIVLWNTIYMDATLRQLRKEGFQVKDERVARQSSLGHEHINMLGR